MNDIVVHLGIQSWKPFLTLLLLPPIPFLVLVLAGARLLPTRRRWGWVLVGGSVLGLYLSFCNGVALFFNRAVLQPPPALTNAQVQALRAEMGERGGVAVVVLGGGRELMAPEYGRPNLTPLSLERLRYGVSLSRRIGAPLGFAGGIGWSQPDQVSESEVAARIAKDEFGVPMKWTDTRSRDTRENARWMLELLEPDGVRKVLLVTHGWHMPRALRDFARAARSGAAGIELIPAPMGLSPRADSPVFDWLPTSEGYMKVRAVLREVWAKLLHA